MRTGDIGIMDAQGYTRIIDRKKDMILVSGFNVFPNSWSRSSACALAWWNASHWRADEKQGQRPSGVHHQNDPALTEGTTWQRSATKTYRLQAPQNTSSSATICPRPTWARSCGRAS